MGKVDKVLLNGANSGMETNAGGKHAIYGNYSHLLLRVEPTPQETQERGWLWFEGGANYTVFTILLRTRMGLSNLELQRQISREVSSIGLPL